MTMFKEIILKLFLILCGLGQFLFFFFLNTDLKLLNADYFNHKNDTLGLSAFNLPFPMKHPCAVPQSPIQRHKPIQVQY